MPAIPEAIKQEKQRLYDTANVRDDLDDAEAEILLKWAEGQVERLAQTEGDFEQQNRFLRQLMARIDRFVGQRQYMDDAAHAEGITNLMKMLAINGYSTITEAHVLNALPSNKADMRANLDAILNLMTPVGTPHGVSATSQFSNLGVSAQPTKQDAASSVPTPVVPETPTETLPPVGSQPTRSIEDPTATPPWLQAIVERVRAAHAPTESPDNPPKQGE
jgi:hypothetical protein